jgi:hypothetical protein
LFCGVPWSFILRLKLLGAAMDLEAKQLNYLVRPEQLNWIYHRYVENFVRNPQDDGTIVLNEVPFEREGHHRQQEFPHVTLVFRLAVRKQVAGCCASRHAIYPPRIAIVPTKEEKGLELMRLVQGYDVYEQEC